MDVVVHDANSSGSFELFEDRILVGAPTINRWRATAFVIDFALTTEETYPQPGDVYQVDWKRPFYETDTITFSITKNEEVNILVDKAKEVADCIEIVSSD